MEMYVTLEVSMNTKSYEECKRILEKLDANTLDRRIERCQELEVIQTRFSFQKEWDYAGEASDTYIAGNYRSAIFCCACAVDQIFRYEYMRNPESRYDEIEGLTFGRIIKQCKKKEIESLLPFIKQAFLLNAIRNDVATHPLFIDIPIESDPDRKLGNSLLLKDITKLLELIGTIDPDLRHEIESTELISESEGRTYIFGEVVKQQSDMPFNLDGFWSLIEDRILKFLANQAWHIMKMISEGLYGIEW